ncbi:hypothetical protein SteCoe_18319 [Stentor coeruleus]|uniref:Uncharacterized protein n=1 Tax=Stentor coeruleus TaxID=5963 RepID=A0A1R2BWR4_9CILI|nr:hypothetical protein SteCoe_18319 [Stentor coeruleus]
MDFIIIFMGRKKSKRGQKKSLSEFEIDASEYFELDIFTSKEGISLLNFENFKTMNIENQRNYIKNYVSSIYVEFTKDIEKNIENFIQSKHKDHSNSLPFLKIRIDFIKKIRPFLDKIKDKESIDQLKNFLSLHANVLTDRLYEHFIQLYSLCIKTQSLIILNIYKYVTHIAKEICKLLSSLLLSYEKIIKNCHQELFYERIMKDRKDIYHSLTCAFPQDEPSEILLRKFNKFKEYDKTKEFDDLSTLTEFSLCEPEIYDEDIMNHLSSVDYLIKKNFQQGFDDYDVDEIVKYIEGNIRKEQITPKKTRKSQRKRESKNENNEMDKEVIEFARKLDESPQKTGLKVVLPENVLEDMRGKIVKFRELMNCTASPKKFSPVKCS